MKNKSFSIIIPVYMNEQSLSETYIRLLSVCQDKNILNKYTYEFIFINDGSTDKSLEELLKIRKIDDHVKIINLTRNFGQLSAIYAGLEKSHSDFVINISADLQDPTAYILRMIEKWEQGYKIVACERIEREDGFLAKFVSFVFYNLIHSLINEIPRGGFDYFLLDKIVYKQMLALDERNSFIQADILWFGYKPFFIKYKRLKRKYGRPQTTLSKKLKYFIDGVFNTTYIPIRLMSMLGLLLAISGFIYAIIVVFAWYFKETPFSGYAPLMIVLLIVSGLLMIMLGIIGEYLWRIYDQVRKRPKFVIQDEF